MEEDNPTSSIKLCERSNSKEYCQHRLLLDRSSVSISDNINVSKSLNSSKSHHGINDSKSSSLQALVEEEEEGRGWRGITTTSMMIPSPALQQQEEEEEEEEDEECGRERLKRHRIEVAGRVWIPDIWGKEELLKDWIDCTAFDASIVSNGLMSARAALVQEGRRANSSGLTIENRC